MGSVEIVQLAVDDEIELVVAERTGGGKDRKGRTIFEDGCFGNAQPSLLRLNWAMRGEPMPF